MSAASGVALQRQPTKPSHLRLVSDVVAKRRTVAPILWIGALTVAAALFGLAAFHNAMATAQYDLERLEVELEVEQARLVDLEFQVERLNSPARVERLARGALGMTDAAEPIDIIVEPDLLAEVQTAANQQPVSGDLAANWSTLKPLLGAS